MSPYFFRAAGSWLRTCGDWQKIFRSLRSRKVCCWKRGSGPWKAGIRWLQDIVIDFNGFEYMHLSPKGAKKAFFSLSVCLTEIFPAWRGHPYICQDRDWCECESMVSSTHFLQGLCGVNLLKSCQRCSLIPYRVIDSLAEEGEVTRSHWYWSLCHGHEEEFNVYRPGHRGQYLSPQGIGTRSPTLILG